MEKADIKKKIHLALLALIFYIQKGTAFSTSPSALTSCASSTANISYDFSIGAGESIVGKRIWLFSGGKIAESNGTTLTPVPSYSSRLTAYGTSGISLSNITIADAGTYAYVIVLLPTGSPFTATTALSVQVAPLAPPSGCQVSATQSSNILKCAVNTNSGNCGTPSLNAFWVNSANTSNQIICNVTETYQCCATSAALTCYNGSSNDFCKLFNCTDATTTTITPSTTTTTNVTVTSSSLSSTPMSSTSMSSTSMFSTSMSSTSMFSTSMSSTPMSSTSMFSTYISSTSMSSTFTSSTSMFSTSMSSTSMFSTSMSSTSMSSSTSSSTSATSSTFTSTSPTTNKTSTGNNGTKGNISGTDIKVIVPAVVVPCGLLIIGAIVLVIFCVRRKAGKNVRESPDGMAIQDEGNNIDGWKQSLGHGNNIDKWKQSFRHGNNIDGWKQSFRHGKATDNLDTVYTTPDGFIIYPGPAAVSTARSYKDKKYHGVTDQYSIPNPGKHHRQADYIPSTFTSARAYTHRGKNHHVVTDQYSRPYPGNYGNQTAYFPSTYKSARTYAQKGKTYEGHQPVSNLMATSRLAYDQPASNLMANSRLAYGQTAYYPQTGYYGQTSQDVYYSGGGQHSYGQRSRSHHDNNGRKQQRDYYSQHEMADYRGDITGYRHTKQDTAFYY